MIRTAIIKRNLINQKRVINQRRLISNENTNKFKHSDPTANPPHNPAPMNTGNYLAFLGVFGIAGVAYILFNRDPYSVSGRESNEDKYPSKKNTPN